MQSNARMAHHADAVAVWSQFDAGIVKQQSSFIYDLRFTIYATNAKRSSIDIVHRK